jgi:hypothetical protein
MKLLMADEPVLIRELLNAMAPTGAAIREAVFMKKL